jgi:hypothetical protein
MHAELHVTRADPKHHYLLRLSVFPGGWAWLMRRFLVLCLCWLTFAIMWTAGIIGVMRQRRKVIRRARPRPLWVAASACGAAAGLVVAEIPRAG